ncbi:hypothetical protein HG536_0B05480 [Torulaspora globosa]|uniref:Myb-like domain-containing protein n=1 Tax=Torulaspora globosa TaxID=48254 RepID=A0A7G3ZDU7_9SACH|nr:uncharacterized protein HG536_0B05480 [Torulaspora globosa]QLL31683.1 hypothetical protein HG536_0B05480 [Torulaspora globosa]
MTLAKSTAGSSVSSHLSILGTHPHPHLHPHHLKSSSSSASVSVTAVETTSTMGNASSGEKSSSVSENKTKNPSSWDPQDDILLRHLKEVKKLGWKDISQYFANRTPNACQFRWRRLKSGNLKSNKTANVDVTDFPGSGNAAAEDEKKSRGGSPAMAIPVSVPPKLQPGVASAPNSVAATPSLPCLRSTFSLTSSNAQNNYPSINSTNGAGSNFFKARSNSHSFSLGHYSTANHSTGGLVSGAKIPAEEENVGFIPKIIVKSRRNSFAQPLAAATNSTTSHLTAALNTTLNTTKTRKNSFAARSRRSSFNVSSNTPSRRGSMITAPTSLTGMFGMSTASSTPKGPRRDSTVKSRTRRSASSSSTSSAASFMDLPPGAVQHMPRAHTRIHPKLQQQKLHQLHPHQPFAQNIAMPESLSWSTEEDQLLNESGSRNLSMMELSILLPNRTDKEIQWRLDTLSLTNSPAASNEASESPLHSPRKSITPEDTAIDEDTCDEAEHNHHDGYDEGVDPLHQSIPLPSMSKENTPASIISSTTTNDDAPTSADNRLRIEGINENKNDFRSYHAQKPRTQHPHTSTTTPLPGISSILNGTL